ncbi:hypothetical protein HOY80DRAFT_945737 [Tuber brumale]|nr:hypothetical protein HOY80DRAFT_945737 [Tuber brumale]
MTIQNDIGFRGIANLSYVAVLAFVPSRFAVPPPPPPSIGLGFSRYQQTRCVGQSAKELGLRCGMIGLGRHATRSLGMVRFGLWDGWCLGRLSINLPCCALCVWCGACCAQVGRGAALSLGSTLLYCAFAVLDAHVGGGGFFFLSFGFVMWIWDGMGWTTVPVTGTVLALVPYCWSPPSACCDTAL